MLKCPLDYFAAQDFSVPPPGTDALSEAEALFMRKYLGVGDIPLPPVLPVLDGDESVSLSEARRPAAPEVQETAPEAQAAPAVAPVQIEDEEAALTSQDHVQFVGFYVGRQLYTIPTGMVNEVIRTLPISQLPMVSPFVCGVMNLRGTVVPLVRLGALLGFSDVNGDDQTPFTIICRGRRLQVGLQIDRVHSMYRIAQQDINWNVEASIGVNGECISGLFLLNEQIVPILSTKRIVEMVLSK